MATRITFTALLIVAGFFWGTPRAWGQMIDLGTPVVYSSPEQLPREPGQVPGIWAATYPTPWGLANEHLVLMHTGTFSRTVVCGPMRVYTTGGYQVGPGFIRYANDYNPRQPNMPRSELHYYHFNGPNQIIFRDEIAGTTWTSYRIGP